MAGANSAVGLKLNEPGWVEQALQSLSAQSSIVRACVYDRQRRPFARYQRAGVQGDFSSPPVLNNGPRLVVVGDQLEFFQEIKLAGERIGTVYLCADLSDTTARIWGYLKALSEHLGTEQARVLRELQELTKNIDHIKEIVAMQQSYAKVSGVVEFHSLPALVEDALRMHLTSLSHHDVHVIRNFDPVPDVLVDKHKILQILVNLISNAKYALSDSNAAERCLTLGVSMDPDNRVRISVADNGIGIASDNLTRIFNHGFTTKKDGHGFGLHSGAIAAREMGGALLVRSDGLGKGATFTLELPARLKDPPAGSLTDRR
jgi:signal transduction histidine kinase